MSNRKYNFGKEFYYINKTLSIWQHCLTMNEFYFSDEPTNVIFWVEFEMSFKQLLFKFFRNFSYLSLVSFMCDCFKLYISKFHIFCPLWVLNCTSPNRVIKSVKKRVFVVHIWETLCPTVSEKKIVTDQKKTLWPPEGVSTLKNFKRVLQEICLIKILFKFVHCNQQLISHLKILCWNFLLYVLKYGSTVHWKSI